MINLAIFASGRGSNAQNIIEEFKNDPNISVSLICSNRKVAGVLDLAEKYNIPKAHLSNTLYSSPEKMIGILNEKNIDLIVLAGFLKLIPAFLIKAFPQKIINIHPALLPKYGGKGMYGMNVHNAVKSANEKHTGMTIHLVNEKYDDGAFIFKASCKIRNGSTAEEIAAKVLKLEHLHYAKIIRQYCKTLFR